MTKEYKNWYLGLFVIIKMWIIIVPIAYVGIFLLRVWDWGWGFLILYLIQPFVYPLIFWILISRYGYIYMEVIIKKDLISLSGFGRKDIITRENIKCILVEKPSVRFKLNDKIGRLLGAQLTTGELIKLCRIASKEEMRTEIESEILKAIQAPIMYYDE